MRSAGRAESPDAPEPAESADAYSRPVDAPRAVDATPPSSTEAGDGGVAAGPVAWKAAASSVPRLRQQPAAPPQPGAPEKFQGFAQDEIIAKDAPPTGGAESQAADASIDARPSDDAMPLARDVPFWVHALDHLQLLRRPIVLGSLAVLVLGAAAVYFIIPRGTRGVSLAQIRQQPEAFEGRLVSVGGKAGETFSVGGSYVFSLYQGRDTIVVYSRSRHPRLHEHVKVDGTVSIGYLDGAPRVAVLEDPSAR